MAVRFCNLMTGWMNTLDLPLSDDDCGDDRGPLRLEPSKPGRLKCVVKCPDFSHISEAWSGKAIWARTDPNFDCVEGVREHTRLIYSGGIGPSSTSSEEHGAEQWGRSSRSEAGKFTSVERTDRQVIQWCIISTHYITRIATDGICSVASARADGVELVVEHVLPFLQQPTLALWVHWHRGVWFPFARILALVRTLSRSLAPSLLLLVFFLAGILPGQGSTSRYLLHLCDMRHYLLSVCTSSAVFSNFHPSHGVSYSHASPLLSLSISLCRPGSGAFCPSCYGLLAVCKRDTKYLCQKSRHFTVLKHTLKHTFFSFAFLFSCL